MTRTDYNTDKIVEVTCSLSRPARPRRHAAERAQAAPAMQEALELRVGLPRITHSVARALLFEQAMASGEAADCADLARLTALSRERVSQVMKMAWLAPDIQEEILRLPPMRRGQRGITVLDIAKIADEVIFDDQRDCWSKLKTGKGLATQ